MTLAELLRLDGVAKAYIPPREVRDTPELLRYRVSVVSLRMVLENKRRIESRQVIVYALNRANTNGFICWIDWVNRAQTAMRCESP
jgi:hypothetical protein